MPKSNPTAQVLLPTRDLPTEINFFTDLGFRLDIIFPADDPAVAVMSGHDMHIRIDKQVAIAPPTIYLLTDEADGPGEMTAPGGTVIKVLPRTFQLNTPPTRHKFEVRRLEDSDAWVIGRAGMLYRDLIPDRLGGSIIASHIRIPVGGPVPDMVHYHTIGFQLIYCYNGWVKLVYEDQGPPFILSAGDCVTQPPEIRHRVLEASDNLEVIEIGVPAAHLTTIDHDMELPTGRVLPDREFQGQIFCRHISADSQWKPWRINGFEHRDTGVNAATRGMASVQVARPDGSENKSRSCSHNMDILFTFVTKGHLSLQVEGHPSQQLTKGDAFVIPPGLPYSFAHFSEDVELLEVALPGIVTDIY